MEWLEPRTLALGCGALVILLVGPLAVITWQRIRRVSDTAHAASALVDTHLDAVDERAYQTVHHIRSAGEAAGRFEVAARGLSGSARELWWLLDRVASERRQLREALIEFALWTPKEGNRRGN